ncbi:hypothetical protein AB0I49_03190 [Streptomyces sp. NPDC050617]|uniref:hypothetical protein n=1 Tax=Streptomyces sp. NPDC050617 TaxID=3154628 RepID=UPI0034491ADE
MHVVPEANRGSASRRFAASRQFAALVVQALQVPGTERPALPPAPRPSSALLKTV